MYPVLTRLLEILIMGLSFPGEAGIIEGAFGTTGKFRVSIPGTWPHTQALSNLIYTHTLTYISRL